MKIAAKAASNDGAIPQLQKPSGEFSFSNSSLRDGKRASLERPCETSSL